MIGAIIQARTGSSRLPNKILRNLCGKPLLWHVINRLKPSKKIDRIVLATTNLKADDILENLANEYNIPFYRGSEIDVLDRYYQTALAYNIDTIVRVTADDPFKDYTIIDNVIDLFYNNSLDFAFNNFPPTFPEGLDVEVFSLKALTIAQTHSSSSYEREHVTQFFYRHPEIFKMLCLKNEEDLSNYRWTIDTIEDWLLAEFVYESLFYKNNIFLTNEILKLLGNNPQILMLNSRVERSSMYKK